MFFFSVQLLWSHKGVSLGEYCLFEDDVYTHDKDEPPKGGLESRSIDAVRELHAQKDTEDRKGGDREEEAPVKIPQSALAQEAQQGLRRDDNERGADGLLHRQSPEDDEGRDNEEATTCTDKTCERTYQETFDEDQDVGILAVSQGRMWGLGTFCCRTDHADGGYEHEDGKEEHEHHTPVDDEIPQPEYLLRYGRDKISPR